MGDERAQSTTNRKQAEAVRAALERLLARSLASGNYGTWGLRWHVKDGTIQEFEEEERRIRR